MCWYIAISIWHSLNFFPDKYHPHDNYENSCFTSCLNRQKKDWLANLKNKSNIKLDITVITKLHVYLKAIKAKINKTINHVS